MGPMPSARPLTPIARPLADVALTYGCPGLVSLRAAKGADAPTQLPYLDLLAKHVRETATLLPDAVAEFQGRPVMYFLDARNADPNPSAQLELQQRLANRGDHAVLAIVRPGDLTLHPLHLSRDELVKHGIGKVISASAPDAPFLFHSIATGRLKLAGQSEHADPVFKEVQTLLVRAIDDLVDNRHLDGMAVLSMLGRALFFRFLIDRNIVDPADLPEICPALRTTPDAHDLRAVFSSAERAAHTSVWLDETFNGDLLPLIEDAKSASSPTARRHAYESVYTHASTHSNGHVFHHLEAILRGWDHVHGATQLRLPIDWDDLNFRHIPIGVLSQVYEDFSHRVDKHDAKSRSVHYTPRSLAKLLVEQALAGLDAPHEARVLDPSCGAGVFLVLVLRELVKLHWQHDARRPTKASIQNILHKQIRGFDISSSALRLAALALYITVIELNDITRPPSEHHASKALQDLVLFDQRTADEKTQRGFVLGSLGDAVSPRFNGAFDVVIGNPPWTRVRNDERARLDPVANATARRVLEARGLSEHAKSYENPGGVPDIPFLWRAMEWAKPGGILAFALDAQLLLSPSGLEARARAALFEAVSVTGVLNGSDLEKTNVWACHDLPWILLWARNEKPNLDEHTFHLLTPVRENELADRGEFRLDYASAYPVPAAKVIEQGWLCKALTLGTTLDVQIMEKLVVAAKKQSIGSFWAAGEKQGLLASTRGLDIQPFKPRKAPTWLLDLEVFDGPHPPTPSPPRETRRRGGEELERRGLGDEPVESHFATYRALHGDREPNNTRRRENFAHPLVVIRRAPGESRQVAKSFRLVQRDLAFSKNFYGYSAAKHPEGRLLVALLHVIAHSLLFQHFAYMTSGQVGVGRRIIDKQDIDNFPLPLLETLSADDRAQVVVLADMIDGSGSNDWSKLDAFVCGLYGLTKAEQQVVEDTVQFNGPYRSVREPAALPTPAEETREFARTLEKSLQPFFKVTGQKLKASVVPHHDEGLLPWRFVTLLMDGETWIPTPEVLAEVMAEATKTSASRVVLHVPGGGLLLGLVNKRRFWTRSRARLCALLMSREHLEGAFPVRGA